MCFKAGNTNPRLYKKLYYVIKSNTGMEWSEAAGFGINTALLLSPFYLGRHYFEYTDYLTITGILRTKQP
jgi:hypothetical protein